MAVLQIILFLSISLFISAYQKQVDPQEGTKLLTKNTVTGNEKPVSESSQNHPRNESAKKRQDEIVDVDLSKIKHLAPKGRTQDREYNNQKIVEELVSHGTDSIPFLIKKLDDETVLPRGIIDYWYKVTVADVAMIILTDFFTESSWKKTTIPGASWIEMISYNDQPGTPLFDWLTEYLEHHGRKPIKMKWEHIWKKNKERIYWDEKERCFKVQ